jgi:serine/threonine protein kinase
MLRPQDSRFWLATTQAGLVEAGKLRACWDAIPDEKRTVDAIDRRLARRVVEAGHLTRWQAQQLILGMRPQSLRYDRYILQDILGQGGMGRVYLAWDSRLNRRVAVKVLARDRMNNPRAVTRFKREARVGAQLQHENLVRIYDEGEAEGHLFLVMEYIEGKTAGRLIGDRGPFPVGTAVRLAREVALGLDHAHRKGLIHRDVNPMNILVDRSGTARLTDLGLALDLGDLGEAVTRDGATVGTFDYISPEQARSSRQLDIRSDLYSLGCTLYHMMTGRVPFPHPSLPEKLYAHQMLEPEPPDRLVPDMPPGLPAALQKLMAKRPGDRYDDPMEAARGLEPFASPILTLAEIEALPEIPLMIDLDSTISPTVASAELAPRPDEPPIVIDTFSPAGISPVGSDVFAILPDLRNHDRSVLSGTSSGSRAAGSDDSTDGRARAGWIAAALGGLTAVALFLGWRFLDPGPTTSSTPPDDPVATAPEPPDPTPRVRAPLVVRWRDDGSEEPQLSLQAAIQRAAGKPAEIILRDGPPVILAPEKPLIISSGRVVIRADDGARPVLRVRWGGTEPLLIVRLDGGLACSGLSFECEPAKITSRTALIESVGNLTLDACAFQATGPARGMTVAVAGGVRTEVRRCVFRDIDSPLRIEAYAGASVQVAHSLFLSGAAPEAAAADAPDGSAITLIDHLSRQQKSTRKLLIDRCTVIGSGLLALDGLTTDHPVEVDVRGSVVAGPHILRWSGPSAFPSGLRWTGGDNRYAIDSPGWVEGPDGPLPDSPNDLESWNRVVRGEAGSRAGPIAFRGGAEIAALREGPITGFALDGPDAQAIGFDPKASP